MKISYLSRFRTPAGRNKNSTFFKPEKAVLKLRNICISGINGGKCCYIGLSFIFNSKCNYLLTVFIGQLFKSSICICSDPANAYLEKFNNAMIHNDVFSLKYYISLIQVNFVNLLWTYPSIFSSLLYPKCNSVMFLNPANANPGSLFIGLSCTEICSTFRKPCKIKRFCQYWIWNNTP